MASLVGEQLKNTYDSLLKTSDNDALGAYKEITDGAGNGSNLYLGTGGNVGIGTDSPDTIMEIKGADPILTIRDSSTSGADGNATLILGETGATDNLDRHVRLALRGTASGPTMAFDIDTTERMRIDSSGNVLVGTTNTTPAQQSSTTGISLRTTGAIETCADGGNSARFNRLSSDGSIIELRKDGITVGSIGTRGGEITFHQGDTGIRLRGGTDNIIPVDASGAGRSNAIDIGSSSEKFKDLYLGGKALIGGGNADPTLNRVNGINILSTGNILSRATANWDLGSNVTAPTHIVFYTDNGSARVTAGNISSSGSTTSFNTSSDYRKKENVVEMTDSLDKISQLKPCEFNFIGEDTTMGGFLAHEVAEVVPNAVTGEKDAVDEEGNPIYQSIDHSKLVPLLVGAIQELKAEIEQLKAQS